eukprot:TRINITY_DN8565_c4_g1_i1.p1 TRINITY_DN8565_c4_g1~~TRINITY_DN8565_c4_g1_i1.p1  ORF type:complete len:124 (+),score=0.23 TRINITY_DN8565_c4_g1_i1:159-530(+)
MPSRWVTKATSVFPLSSSSSLQYTNLQKGLGDLSLLHLCVPVGFQQLPNGFFFFFLHRSPFMTLSYCPVSTLLCVCTVTCSTFFFFPLLFFLAVNGVLSLSLKKKIVRGMGVEGNICVEIRWK